jgi:hypothetical protein
MPSDSGDLLQIMNELARERAKQDGDWGELNSADVVWSTMLSAKYGAVSNEVLRLWHAPERNQDELLKQLISLAALAIAWIECVHRRRG